MGSIPNEHSDRSGETRRMRRAAVGYLQRGWAVIPLPRREKRPGRNGWQGERWRPEDVPKQWTNGQNIGVLLGGASGNLTDLDLDCDEARQLAGRFFPPTLTTTRASSPDSHWWYKATDREVGQHPLEDLDGEQALELRGGAGHHTLLPPSEHPSGEEWKWSASGLGLAELRADELLRRYRELGTAVVVARCLPETGRHRCALPLVGYLLGKLDPETTERIVVAAWDAAGYAAKPGRSQAEREAKRDLAAIVADTAEKIENGEAYAGGGVLEERLPGLRKKLAKLWGWGSFAGGTSATSENRDYANVGQTVYDDADTSDEPPANHLLAGRVDLGEAMRGRLEPPDELEPDVLLAGKIHHLFGPSESGKTLVALWAIKRRIEAGETVVAFDAENGTSTIAERLRQMGADPDLVSARLIYLPFPDLTLRRPTLRDFYAILDGLTPTLIVFDSWASFLSVAGLSENENSEIEDWDNALTKHAKKRGITSLILDHPPHDGLRSRGGARKKEVADVQWRVKKTQPFDRDTVGEIVLVNEKDREGWLPKTLTFSVGGAFGKLICERSSGTVDDQPGADNLTTKERTVLRTLCDEFPLTGASASEWQRATEARDVARATHFRAVKKLVSFEVSSALRVSLVNETYYPPNETEPQENDETSENPVGKPDSSRSHEVSNESHETDDTGAKPEVSSGTPPFKGGTVRPDAETYHEPEAEKDDERLGEAGPLSADEERRRAELVRQGMAPHIARAQVLRWRSRKSGGRRS